MNAVREIWPAQPFAASPIQPDPGNWEQRRAYIPKCSARTGGCLPGIRAARTGGGPAAVTDAFARYPSLRDRAVLVTGGATGIGAAIVEHFAAQDARVAFLDVDDAAGNALAAGLAAQVRHAPAFLSCDLRDVAALEAAIGEAARRHGAATVLVNNAANDDRHRPEDTSVALWDDRMAVNLRPMFFAAKAVAPGMKEAGGGSIVNFGSISWMLGQGGMPAYTTAKAAVHGLTRGLARDWGSARIRVNTVSPGWVMTERQIRLWLTPEGERALHAGQCLPDRILPPDVARLVLWLAADDSRMVTAQNFVVDGGWANA
jgi:NAD(P)-dependent dehydrogenase (short-subunit alcohol dehydrogenase family)